MDVGMAESAGLDLHDDLPRAGFGLRHFFDAQWLVE
jgi:hypothetical protein